MIEETLSDLPVVDPETAEVVVEADREARRRASRVVEQLVAVR